MCKHKKITINNQNKIKKWKFLCCNSPMTKSSHRPMEALLIPSDKRPTREGDSSSYLLHPFRLFGGIRNNMLLKQKKVHIDQHNILPVYSSYRVQGCSF